MPLNLQNSTACVNDLKLAHREAAQASFRNNNRLSVTPGQHLPSVSTCQAVRSRHNSAGGRSPVTMLATTLYRRSIFESMPRAVCCQQDNWKLFSKTVLL